MVKNKDYQRMVVILCIILLFLWTGNIQHGPNGWKPEWTEKRASFVVSHRSQNDTVPSHIARNDGKEAESEPTFHYVFSTGCNAFQDWQSWTFFYNAHKVGIDHVTRVASGCSDSGMRDIVEAHNVQVKELSSNFQLHLTKDYSKVIPGKNYKFFNKPFGLKDWMENGLGFPDSTSVDKNTVFVIMDPDELLLRPFQRDMTDVAATIKWKSAPGSPVEIRDGQPFGQLYGFGSSWIDAIDMNLTYILSHFPEEERINSHLHSWTAHEVEKHYAAGPPYIATASDMYQIVKTWANIAIPVYHVTDNFLSEMFAYSTAAAHLGLKHNLALSFMVSNVNLGAEGWDWANSNDASVVCSARSSNLSVVSSTHYLPNVLHFCQRYFLGPYFFSKYILPKNFLTCDHPLLVEPELNIADLYETSVTPNGVLNEIPYRQRNRHAFMLCIMIARLNEAAFYWKDRHCTGGNVTKSFLFEKKQK